jgi:hypothetical protein
VVLLGLDSSLIPVVGKASEELPPRAGLGGSEGHRHRPRERPAAGSLQAGGAVRGSIQCFVKTLTAEEIVSLAVQLRSPQIMFLISIRIPFPTSYKISDVTSQNFSSMN